MGTDDDRVERLERELQEMSGRIATLEEDRAAVRAIPGKLEEVLEHMRVFQLSGSAQELNQDMMFVRSIRKRSEESGTIINRVTWSTLIGAGFWLLWYGIEHKLKGN